MYLPPVLRPLAAASAITPGVRRIAEAPISVVRGVPGSYAAERLAGVVDSWQRLHDCVWLRAHDVRPTDLAQSLAAACKHRWSPGEPETGWLPAARLGDEIQGAPEGAVIVLELGSRVTPGVARLVKADGRVDDCIATAHRMLDIDPCREDAHRLLMRCYAAQGRTYQAVRQYQFCTRILRVTIDASPTPDTSALYDVIRNGSPAELAKLG